MKPWAHALISLILAAILYPVFNWQVVFIFVGGVLIHIDHYFWYVYKFRKFNLEKCYKYHIIETRKNNFEDVKGILQIFHTIELLFLAIIFSIFSQSVLMFTIGLLSHYIMDVIERYSSANSFVTNPSLISWIIKNKIRPKT